MENDRAFQPFTDRLSRDIRNDLSRALVRALETGSLEPAQRVAKRYLDGHLPADHSRYISDRLRCYERILAHRASSPVGPLPLAFRLWDETLFFEVHEVLEPLWLKASGEEKLLLQALIRAAGVYIKLEAGYPDTATRIAAKALPVLERNRELLARHIAADSLLDALAAPDLPAPRLCLPADRQAPPEQTA